MARSVVLPLAAFEALEAALQPVERVFDPRYNEDNLVLVTPFGRKLVFQPERQCKYCGGPSAQGEDIHQCIDGGLEMRRRCRQQGMPIGATKNA